MYQEVIDEIECSLALLEPSALRVKPTNLSFKKGWFSGIWAKYKAVDVFIPHNELKPPYHLRSPAENLVKSGTYIKVYSLRIDIDKESRDPRKWQIPICTMFSPTDRARAVMEVEEIRAKEINIRPGTVIEGENFKLEVVGVEYHNGGNEKRPKSVVFRITAPSKYPILRSEQKTADLKKWEELSERSDRKSSKTIRRFFYERKRKNALIIGNAKITLLPIFGRTLAKELWQKGYVGRIKIKRGK